MFGFLTPSTLSVFLTTISTVCTHIGAILSPVQTSFMDGPLECFWQRFSKPPTFAGMIDRWSLIHMVLLIGVGVVQVLLVRRLFNAPLPKQGMKMRT